MSVWKNNILEYFFLNEKYDECTTEKIYFEKKGKNVKLIDWKMDFLFQFEKCL